MPELPEVETVCRGLAPAMAGWRFVSVEQRRPDLRWPLPPAFAARLEGRRVMGLARRAKFLLGALEGGETLVMHLGMSGRFTIASSDGAVRRPGVFAHEAGGDPAHDHVIFRMSNGLTVTYNDPRRFGFMDLVPDGEVGAHPLMKGLGVEPLGNAFTADYLAAKAAGRRTDLKAFLLDQRVVAGLGNIYVSEALHRARLSPHRSAGSLARADGRPSLRAERLVPAIRDVLIEAIEAGGSTLRDYKLTDGSRGDFQHDFRVYGRDGAPCLAPGCTGRVQRIVQGGRSTFYCGGCQR